MDVDVRRDAEKLNKGPLFSRRWQQGLRVMSQFVVFWTTYAMILPAITWDRSLICELPEHTHTEMCYEEVLVPAGEKLICGFEEHQHDDSCYVDVETLVCTVPEAPAHEHTPECYSREPVLVCEEEHEHTAECCEERDVLICGLTETAGHTHTEACYTVKPTLACGKTEHTHTPECSAEHTERVTVCGLEEHEHSYKCYDAPAAAEEKLPCGFIEHRHNEGCYFEDGTLFCTIPEHTHTPMCRQDLTADIEDESAWHASLGGLVLSGKWSKDVLAVAETQIAYEASEKNFILAGDNDFRHYTRYGAWYKQYMNFDDSSQFEYAEWCAMFASFCIDQAGVKDFPYEASCRNWVEKLSEKGLYHPAGSYQPRPGDLVFIDFDAIPEGPDPVRWADHVGIVQKTEEEDGELGLFTIEGNIANSVIVRRYKPDDRMILGYAEIPENPDYVPELRSEPATDGAVAVVRGELPEGAEVTIERVELTERKLKKLVGEDMAEEMNTYVVYDIKIMVNGEEWQPGENVKVSILQPAVEVAQGDAVGVVHIDGETSEPETVNATVDTEGVNFETPGFSLYVVYSYTVDFHYNGITYNLNGTGTMALSELFEALEIDCALEDIDSVIFSDETLVRIEKQPEPSLDWDIVSLLPFDTDETLTVVLKNGAELVIPVTDAGSNSGTTSLTRGTFTVVKNCSMTNLIQSHPVWDSAGAAARQGKCAWLKRAINDDTHWENKNGAPSSNVPNGNNFYAMLEKNPGDSNKFWMEYDGTPYRVYISCKWDCLYNATDSNPNGDPTRSGSESAKWPASCYASQSPYDLSINVLPCISGGFRPSTDYALPPIIIWFEDLSGHKVILPDVCVGSYGNDDDELYWDYGNEQATGKVYTTDRNGTTTSGTHVKQSKNEFVGVLPDPNGYYTVWPASVHLPGIGNGFDKDEVAVYKLNGMTILTITNATASSVSASCQYTVTYTPYGSSSQTTETVTVAAGASTMLGFVSGTNISVTAKSGASFQTSYQINGGSETPGKTANAGTCSANTAITFTDTAGSSGHTLTVVNDASSVDSAFTITYTDENGTAHPGEALTVAAGQSVDNIKVKDGTDVTVTATATGKTVTYTLDTGQEQTGASATVSNMTADHTITFKIVNPPGHKLTVTKALAGGPTSGAFEFTVTYGETSETRTITLPGTDSFEIENIPNGASVTVTETLAPGFYVSYQVDSGTVTAGNVCENLTMDADRTVTFTNTAGSELPKTGGIGSDRIYMSGILLIAGAAACGCIAKRRRRERGSG